MAIEDFVVSSVLSLEGVPDKVTKDIEADLPELMRLCRSAKLLSPIVNEALPIVKQLMPKLNAIGDAPVREALPMLADLSPLIDRLMPLYQQAMIIVGAEQSDINAVTPAILELVDFLNKKGATSGPIVNMTPQE